MGWVAWALAATFYAYGFFLRVAPSVLVDDLMRAYDLAATGVGTLTAAYFYAYASVQIPVGVLVDRLGPRTMVMGAAVAAALAGVAFAAATTVEMALIARAGIGFATGVAYISCLKTAAQWFPPQRFGLLTGLTLAAGVGGAIGAQAPLAWLAQLVGWREALYGISLTGLVVAAAIWFLVPQRPPGGAGLVAHREGHGPSLSRLIRDPQILTAAFFTGALGSTPLAFAGLWGVPYFTQVHELNLETAGLATSSMLLVWAIAGPVLGWLGDRFHARRAVMLLSGAGLLTGWVGLTFEPEPPVTLAIALSLLLGIAAGGMIVAFAQAQSRFDPAVAGRVAGLVNSSVLLFGAIMQTVIGWRLDQLWTGEMEGGVRIYAATAYQGAFALFVVLALGAIIAAWRLADVPRADSGRAAAAE